jgi:glycerate 2-kinase
MTLSTTARAIFLETLRHLRIDEAMQRCVVRQGTTLFVGDRVFRMEGFRRVVVIAIGKAAVPMCDALLDRVDPALRGEQVLEGIVAGALAPTEADPRIRYFLGDHPLPGPASEGAAEAILELLSGCDESCMVFFLISGGSSAMVERALDPQLSLDDVLLFHRSLVHSGLPIAQMNALRKHFSRVKGGRLAVAAGLATQCTLLISDVPEKRLDVVGSGPSLPDPSTLEECRQILDANQAALKLPERLVSVFRDPAALETPKADHPAFRQAGWLSLLSSSDLTRVAGELAEREGFHVAIDNDCDDWDYARAAEYLIDRMSELLRVHPRVCLLSAGEIAVPLPTGHGIGGRNQQFVLECARLLSERRLSAAILSAGSDGVDGNSPAAGAVCDETTVRRAAAIGRDVATSLARFDSFSLLDALGDTVITGPTGNNVRDLRIFLAER